MSESPQVRPPVLKERIAQTIMRIPRGEVATYGQVAAMAGNARASRLVVWVLTSSKGQGLPWYRVVNSGGTISLKHGGGYERQKALLESERVIFDEDDRIDLKRFQWRVPDDNTLKEYLPLDG